MKKLNLRRHWGVSNAFVVRVVFLALFVSPFLRAVATTVDGGGWGGQG
ncbi:MAG: hypothetical protein KGJ80_02390 [Chloroflexota bacterium]|nr:hypothetical protein [Chloroflexota bacterium]